MQDDPTSLRLQLLSRGWSIIPNIGKECRVPGWNRADWPSKLNHRYVARWAAPSGWPGALSTGVRVENGLVVLDADIDAPLADDLLSIIQGLVPDLPTRSGTSPYKAAVFGRLVLFEGDEPFARWASKTYQDADGKHHLVEVFGGKPTAEGNCSRQFSIYGPHPDGANYSWLDAHQLTEMGLQDLPALTIRVIGKILDAFERLATAAGWVEVDTRRLTASNDAVYDLTDDTLFDIQGGERIGYLGLDAGQRCSSSFFDPNSGGNRSKCWVFKSGRHDGSIAVYDHKLLVTHYHQRFAPPDLKTFAEKLETLDGDEPAPIAMPRWREVYAGSGYPKPSLHNTRVAIDAIRLLGSKDVFHNKLLLGRSSAISPLEPIMPFLGDVTDSKIGLLRMWLSDAFGFDFTEKHVRDAVVIMCDEHPFDPVVEMLADAQANWDQKPRLDRMAVDYFNAEDTPLHRAFVRKTMLGAVARARIPGCKFDTILTTISKEGWNKSSSWAVLAGEGNFSDASILGHHMQAREVQEHLAGVWIHENSELAGMSKADIEAVKAFASRQEDRARPAFGHFLLVQPRHSIEVATTNDGHPLLSQTGNRRFWPVGVQAEIDLDKLRAHRLQLWGEAAHLQALGESVVLDRALWAAAEAAQEAHRLKHPWEAVLARMLPMLGSAPNDHHVIEVVGDEHRVATWAIFEHVLKIPNGQQNNGHAKTLAACMRLHGWQHGVFLSHGKTTRGYTRTTITANFT